MICVFILIKSLTISSDHNVCFVGLHFNVNKSSLDEKQKNFNDFKLQNHFVFKDERGHSQQVGRHGVFPQFHSN